MSDHARPLNARGRAAAATIRAAMREHGLAPDVVLVSSARRTLQTLEALEPWDETPIVEPMNRLYLANPATILAILKDLSATVRAVMIVGHNPGLHELAMLLAGGHAATSENPHVRRLAEGFPAGALAEFNVAQSWRDLGESGGEGGGRLVRFLCPRDLPELAR